MLAELIREIWECWEIIGEIRSTVGRNTSGRIIKQVSNKRLYHTWRMLRGHTDFLLPFRDKKKNFCFQLRLALLLRRHRSPDLEAKLTLTATMLSQPNINYSHVIFRITQFTGITL